MSIKGREQVGEFIPDNLIAGNRHPVDVCMVWIQAGQNLKRGTLLEAAAAAAGTSEPEDSEEETADTSVKYVIRGTSADAEAEYILADDVDATEEDTAATVYRTGEFAENAVIVKEGYTISDADRKALRNAGIFLTGIMM